MSTAKTGCRPAHESVQWTTWSSHSMNRELTASLHHQSPVYLRTVAPPGLARALCVALALLAFALRAYHLDFQSFWSDEGISIIRSNQLLGQMWQSMPVEHVPGYFLLLHGWMKLSGQADYGLRFLSLLPSVWAVALVYRLGIDLGSRRAGLIAAALIDTSAFQVWYAQEARMYSWLLAIGLLSTWFFWLLLTAPTQQPGK